jgi:hypothetical protein
MEKDNYNAGGLGSPRGGKNRTFFSFSILARVRVYAKRNPETGYRFLDLCSPKDALTDFSTEDRQGKLRRNPVALAREWQSLLDSGQVPSRAALARELGISRAHVTQVLDVLRLSHEQQQEVLALGDPIQGKTAGIHSVRKLGP